MRRIVDALIEEVDGSSLALEVLEACQHALKLPRQVRDGSDTNRNIKLMHPFDPSSVLCPAE